MPGRDDTVRAFVALPCPPELRRAIASELEEWRGLGGGVRWTPPERIHLTLRFLGDSTPDEIEEVAGDLRGISARTGPLEVVPDGIGAFPGWKRPRVVWLGLDGGEWLERLAEAVEEAVRAAGFDPEERPFHPHLTLARIKGRGAGRAIRAVRGWRPGTGREIVDEIVVYRSDLRPDGPRYTPIERFRLEGSAT